MNMIRRYIKAGLKKISRKIDSFRLKGDKVVCELCSWQGIYFPKGRCPKCNSLPRTRLIPYSINYFSLQNKKINILHVAPNESEYTFIKNKFETTVYDRLDIRNRKHINQVQDLCNTNLKDNFYDLIIAWHVLEHIPDDISAIKEMRRILKKDGKILISVPIYPKNNPYTYENANIERKDYLKIHGHHDHCRSCGFDYYKKFENCGFITDTLINSELNKDIIKKYGLSKGHRVWLFY